MKTLRPGPARNALRALGFNVVGTGGSCAAYTRELAGASSMIVVAGDCVPPTRVRGEPIFVGFYDAEGRGVTLEFADLAAFLFARDGWAAFEAWRTASFDGERVVSSPASVMSVLTTRRAPIGLVAAVDRAIRADEIVQIKGNTLGLFGPSLVDLDLSSYGFWAGPGAWVIVLEDR